MIDYSLYLCTNSDLNNKYSIEECVRQAIIGGVTFVQIREKNKLKSEILEIAKKIQKVTSKYDIPLVINDNVDIAISINADGVHIGQSDMPCVVARKKLGDKKIIGVSVTTLEEAKQAILDGASYLGVGAVYKSYTKADAKVVGEEELEKIIDFSSIPVVIIGGINENTIPNFKNKNISGYAMIRPILCQEDIISSTQKLKKLIVNNRNEIL